MRFPRALALSALSFLAVACASKSSSNSSGPQDPGVTADPGGNIQGHDDNPYGVPYPSDHIGFKARGNSTVPTAPPGDRIANFKFLGYPNGDKSQGLQPVALADYFDPQGKEYKIVHISVAGVWCTWCIQEMQAVVPLIGQLKDKGVVYLTALAENISHGPAAQPDLDFWLAKYKPTYTQVLDPANQKLGPFFTSAGIPWNGNFDARTMEVLSSDTSAPANAEGQIDIMGDVQPWLDWYAANPPSYK
jgi:hypothetical protein